MLSHQTRTFSDAHGFTAQPALELRGVSRSYGRVKALEDLSLTVPRGQVLALLGPNGAGKTTAISLMLGLSRPDSGVAEMFGAAPDTISNRLRTGAVMQLLTQGVTMPAGTWLKLFAIMVMGVVPFCALGLTFGYLVGPNAAPVLVNIIYMPMGFLSGMWMSLSLLPSFIQSVAPWLPTYHFGQLALLPLGASELCSPWPSVLYLTVFSVVFLVLAVLLYRRDSGKSVG